MNSLVLEAGVNSFSAILGVDDFAGGQRADLDSPETVGEFRLGQNRVDALGKRLLLGGLRRKDSARHNVATTTKQQRNLRIEARKADFSTENDALSTDLCSRYWSEWAFHLARDRAAWSHVHLI